MLVSVVLKKSLEHPFLVTSDEEKVPVCGLHMLLCRQWTD
jgi:hypothetical protein